jgi:hypothetical protein
MGRTGIRSERFPLYRAKGENHCPTASAGGERIKPIAQSSKQSFIQDRIITTLTDLMVPGRLRNTFFGKWTGRLPGTTEKRDRFRINRFFRGAGEEKTVFDSPFCQTGQTVVLRNNRAQ